MHTNAKRLFSLLLTALLAASLCACGQQSFDRTEGIEPAAAVTDESGETTLYSDSYYVDTGYRISGYCNRHFPCAARSSPSHWGRERSCNS